MPLSVFTYDGVKLQDLRPVTEIKDYDMQLEEINKRLSAMYDWCLKNETIFTPVHMRNVLKLYDDAWKRAEKGYLKTTLKKEMLDGTEGKARRKVPIEQTAANEEKIRFVRARANLLQQWVNIANQMCLDKCATDTIPSRSIYMSKSIFQNWDTPQNTKSDKVSIEVLLNPSLRERALEAKERRSKNAKRD